MYKNLLMILVAAVFLMSCGGQNTTSQDEQAATQDEIVVNKPTVITLAEFQEKAETLVGKEVILEGNIIHVCKHGGKKMFITADDPDVRIKITTGEETVAFEPELEGSYITVLGIVEAMEAEIVDESELHEEGEHEEDADHANIYHKPQYSVVCVEYTVKETSPEEK